MKNRKQFGWEAIYGAMFVPELVECGVAVGAGDGLSRPSRVSLASGSDGGATPDAQSEGGTSVRVRGFTAQVSPLPNPTDTIMQVITGQLGRQKHA